MEAPPASQIEVGSFKEEIDLIFATANAVRQAQKAILERPWLRELAPIFFGQSISIQDFEQFASKGVTSLGLHVQRQLEEPTHAESE